jgi:hypothetical protein
MLAQRGEACLVDLSADEIGELTLASSRRV